MGNGKEAKEGKGGCLGAPPFEKRKPSSATKEALERADGGKGAGGGGPSLGRMEGGIPRVPEE